MKTDATDTPPPAKTTRRRFIATSTLAGVGLMLAPRTLNAQNAAVPTNRALANALNVAVVGCGAQGQILLNSLSEITRSNAIPLRLVALCDIWPFQLNQVVARERRSNSPRVNGYAEFDDMLAKEKSLDAVFIATPDFLHAPQATRCLNAGLHVYCEMPMAYNGTDARAMVRAMRASGKLLQIGYQRRSNPNYRYAHEILQQRANLLGRIGGASAEHYRAFSHDLKMPRREPVSHDVMRHHGFEDAHQFRNWQWFKKYSVGPIAGISAHQLDVFNWWLGRPNALSASGGVDHYSTHEHCDNISTCLTYATPSGAIYAAHRLHYAALKSMGYDETFFSAEGRLRLSEVQSYIGALPSRGDSKKWKALVKERLLLAPLSLEEEEEDRKKIVFNKKTDYDALRRKQFLLHERVLAVKRGEVRPPFRLPSSYGQKYIHQPHVENFLRAVRGEEKLNCDGTVAFESEVPLYRINDAVAAEKTLHFTDADFAV